MHPLTDSGGHLMLRISSLEVPGERVTLRLEGQVVGPWVEELRRVCERVLNQGGRLSLDLRNVSFFDREGLLLCRRLVEQQVSLENPSAFVAEQLKGARCDGCLGIQV
jgi:hypothetical protein